MSSSFDVVNFKTINFNVGEEPPFDAVSFCLCTFNNLVVFMYIVQFGSFFMYIEQLGSLLRTLNNLVVFYVN